MPLVQAAARDCLAGFNTSMLQQLIARFSIDVPANASLFGSLMAVARFVLPSASEDELLRILGKRFSRGEDDIDDLLQCSSMLSERPSLRVT